MRKATIQGIASAKQAQISMIAMAMIHHDVAVRLDREDKEDVVVVIVVAQGDILEMAGTIEDRPGGVVRDVINR